MIVAALAGRRTDKSNASEVFPARNADRVEAEIARVLLDENVDLLVSSAAAGADLLALRAAGRLGIDRYVVLPFEPMRFRQTSVVDRGIEWGLLFDQIVTNLRSTNLKVLQAKKTEEESYQSATHELIKQASMFSGSEKPLAIVVWDNIVRDSSDFTDEFRLLAKKADFKERVVLTL